MLCSRKEVRRILNAHLESIQSVNSFISDEYPEEFVGEFDRNTLFNVFIGNQSIIISDENNGVTYEEIFFSL